MEQQWNSTFYDESHDFVAKYGVGIFSYLHPRPGERILDLGCGTGDLTNKIFNSGAKVIGVDSSVDMVEKSKSKFPEIEFHQMDVRELHFDKPFDAVFSNAVLHWIPEKQKAINQIEKCLKKGGRMVVEFGGKGNNQVMLKALRAVLIKRGFHDNARVDFWYYPSIGEYAMELEKQNFRVVHAEHFDRSTPLKGEEGMKDWFLMFGNNFFNGITDMEKEDILNEVQTSLAKSHLKDGTWYADYKRIRIVAVKT